MRHIDVSFKLGKEAAIEESEETIPFIITVKGVHSSFPPIAFLLAIDTSMSMDGEKIYRAKEAALKVLRLLRERDLVAVYGFHGKVRRVLEPTPLTDRPRIEKAIVGLKLGYGTNLYAILDELAKDAEKLLKSQRVGAVRVILLTDGEPTSGPKKPKKILEAARKLRQAGATALIIGVGDEYNEKLLLDIAGAVNGIFEHVRDPESLEKTMIEYTAIAKEVSARNVVLSLKLNPGFRVIVYGREVHTTNEGIEIPVGDVHYREVIDIAGDIKIPPLLPGEITIGQLTARYINPDTGEQEYLPPHNITIKVIRAAEAHAAEIHEEVMAEARAFRAAEDLRRALEKGRVEELTQDLEEIFEATLRIGGESLYSRTLDIKERVEKEGVTPETQKEIASLLSRLMSGRVREEKEAEKKEGEEE